MAAFVAASALLLAVYLVVLAQMPLDVFWHPDEGAKYISLQSVRWEGGLHYELPYGGERLDPERRFYPSNQIYPARRADGSVAFRWPILFPLITWPFEQVFGLPGIYILPLLSGWLVAVLAGLWTQLFVPRAGPVAVLLVGLATPVAFYSVSFFEHTPSVLLAGLALTALVLRPGRLSTVILMMPPLAVAVALRVETVAFAAAALLAWGISAVARWRWEPRGLLRAPRSTWVLAVVAALVVLGSYLAASSFVPERHEEILSRVPKLLGALWDRRPHFFDSLVGILLGDPHITDPGLLRIWQVASLLALGGLVVAPFADNRRTEAVLILPALLVVLQSGLLTVMHSLPFLQRQGVLSVAPFTAIALFAVPEAFRRRDSRLLALASTCALATVFGFLALYATRIDQHGGRSLLGLDGGVRYLLWLYPVGTAASLVALASHRASDAPRLARSLFTILVGSLMIVSFYYEVLGVQELRAKREVLVQWREEIRRQEPVVTDIWWLPAVIAPYWLSSEMYEVDGPGDLRAWLELASKGGVAEFSHASPSLRGDPRRGGDVRAELIDFTNVFDLAVRRFRAGPPVPVEE